ncbi:MAG: PKD domain-containing protein [Patescibacteria group bacterium]|nr:PKD domain-containing protein [Patescibacteria group bacterium]
MRIAVLLTLVVLFPTFVYADSPPTVETVILHDTIYPSATVESGLAATTSIDIVFSEQVKASIKILSADGTIISSLYSSSKVTNPTPKIWDGTDDTGASVGNGVYIVLISAVSVSTGLSMTDSSKTITVALPPNDSDPAGISSDTTDTPPPSSGGGPVEYLPVPTLRIVTSGDRTISSGAEVAFTAVVYDGNGNKRSDAVVTWSFGDGMQKTGASVFHAYYNSGEYVATVRATTSDGGGVLGERVVTVKDARIKITSVSSRGIALTNSDSRTLDLSLWRLSMGGQEFKIPADTKILADHTILFPSQIIELPIANSASLLYPSGETAAVYPSVAVAPTTVVQPTANKMSYEQVQAVEPPVTHTVEPIIRTENIQAHEEAVSAPTAAIEVAAVGAASLESSAPGSSVAEMFKSPWAFGLLGVIVVASGAFILL